MYSLTTTDDDDSPEEEIDEEYCSDDDDSPEEETDEEYCSELEAKTAGGALSVSRRKVVAETEYDDDSFEDDSEDEEHEDYRSEPKSALARNGKSDEEDKNLEQFLQHSGSGSEADSDSVISYSSLNKSLSDYAGSDNSKDSSDGDCESDSDGDNHDDCDPNYMKNSARDRFASVGREEQWKKGRFSFNN